MTFDGWSNKSIGELCRFSNGYGFRPPDWSKDGLPIIRIQNLNGSTEFNYFNGIPDESWLVEPGTILFAWAGTRGVSFGPTIWRGPRGVLNQHIYRIHPHKNVNPQWLYAALEIATKNIEQNAHGFKATLLHVRKEEITNQIIRFPPLCEQQKIVTVLSDIDFLIESLDKLIAKKRDIKQATMQQLLTGKVRLPGFGGEWEKKKLGERCEFYSGGTPSTANSLFYGGSINWITSSDLNKKRIKNVEGRITKLGFERSSAKMVKKGTLLLALYGATAGVTAITEIDAAINQAVLAIIPQKDSSEFLFQKLTSLKDWIIKTYTQGGQPNLSGQVIKSVEVLLPSVLEQQAIATILTDMDAEITALERKRDKVRALKQGMMQELLTGKTRLL